MWKKLLIVCITLLGTFSMAYGYYHFYMHAASFTSGGNVTGRIGPRGHLPNGAQGSFQKGDSVLFSEHSPEGDRLAWRLIKNKLSNASNPGEIVSDTSDTGYETVSAPVVTHDEHTWHVLNTRVWGPIVWGNEVSYRKSNVKPILTALNQEVAAKDNENNMIIDRLVFNNDGRTQGTNANFIDYSETKIFVFHTAYETNAGYLYNSGHYGLGLTNADIAMSNCAMYWATIQYSTFNALHPITCSNGDFFTQRQPVTESYPYRFGTFLDLNNVIFALSFGTQQGVAAISAPKYTDGALMTTATGADMKMRVLNEQLTIDFHGIQNQNGQSTAKVIENGTIYLSANANAGSDDRGNPYTVSALIFDSNNNFKYYRPLSSANGNRVYELDMSGIDRGKYKLALVNEAYSETDATPADCSLISDFYTIDVVEPHKISYTKSPQSGASSGKEYEYSKNVNAGQKIGFLSLNPIGITPIQYEIVSFDGSDDTYVNFEIAGLDQNHSSSLNTLDVKIKTNARDLVNNSLKGGTYKFCILAKDANNDPPSPTSDTKACTSLIVKPTGTSVQFDHPNQTKKSMSEATNAWQETATSNPGNGTKITYSKVGGDISLIDIDADTGEITYRGNDLFGMVKIRASCDDDPTSGNDNYESSYTEKEIMIYRNVDGIVTPHSASSDHTVPTFTVNQSNVRVNGVIGTISGSYGTPDPDDGSRTTYTYGLKEVEDYSFFQVNERTGVITTKANLGVDTYQITVTVSDHWSTKEIPITIKVEMSNAESLFFYETPTSNQMITSKTVCLTDTNVSVYATVKGSTNHNPVRYSIQDGSSNVIEVNSSSGAVTIHGVGTVMIVAEKQGESGQANARTELTFTVTAGAQNFIYTDESGNELPKTLDKYNAWEETYGRDKTFQLHTNGNPPGSTVTYALKAGSPTDVLSVEPNGLITIYHASLNNQMGKVIVEAMSHDPTGNYTDKTIELPINIKKADQTVSFADVTYAASGSGTVTPLINAQDISSNAGGVTVDDTNYYITVDTSIASGIAWSNDGINIQYNYSGEDGLDIPLHVEKQGNRNYNKATADGQMRIMGPDESSLAVNVPGRIVYGDHFTIRSLQDDSSSSNVQYQFEVDNTTYISPPTMNGNQAAFDALKYSGNTMIKIKVTRTADGEVPLSKTISVKVLPKDINIIIDDQTKLKGEQNPVLTYQDFSNQLVSWNGVRDSILPRDVHLTTIATSTSPPGTYPIKGDARTLNTKYTNYSFTFTEGTLTIEEESVEDDWYHLALDDGNHTPYSGEWTNQDVNIVSDHDEYIELSINQTAWNQNQTTIVNEGSYDQSFWMRKASGATTTEKQASIKIDKKAPMIKEIKERAIKPNESITIITSDTNGTLAVSGTKTIDYTITKQERSRNTNVIQETVDVNNESVSIKMENAGTYEVCAKPKDSAGNIGQEKCETIEVKKIDVDVDDDGKPDFNDPDGDGCPDLNIKWKDDGNWIVINGDRDYDGIPDLNIDSDGDGLPDLNIDTDNDGKPDINLVILKKTDWKPTKCVRVSSIVKEEYCTGTSVKPQINIDTNKDKIPDINIDINGDMKADINIDQNKNNQLDEFDFNLTSKINSWKPDKDYTSGKFQYDTETEYKAYINVIIEGTDLPSLNIDLDGDGLPDVNIDQDGDGIPETNIDGDGDGKADINLDLEGTGTPQENIITITEWKPDTTIKGEHFQYLTMKMEQKNELEDNGIKIEKPDGTPFLPNFALKVEDVTDAKKTEITSDAKEFVEDIREVKKVFNVKLFKDDEEVQPDGTLKVKIPHEGIKNPILMRKNAQGIYEKIEYTIEGDYLVYETDELGIVSIIGDKDFNTSVLGTYTPNIGGAITGDETDIYYSQTLMLLSIIVLIYLKRNKQKDTFQ